MTKLFTAILNMSITASYISIAVIVIRIFLKKIPKIFSYALWSAVLIRLVCPFSFNSTFSFFNFLNNSSPKNIKIMEYVPYNIGLSQKPAVNVGIGGINNAVNSSLPAAAPSASVNPMQIAMEIASIIWVCGMAILLIYSVISYLKILNNVKTATLVKDNIFETDRIATPFVCGFLKPKIYIPTEINESDLPYVLSHENTHIKRLDYIIKPFAFLILIIHWFNPLMWISFALMTKDMEMSCDESVMRKMGSDVKKNYSNSLLSLSVKRSGLIMGSPLAFGESNIKSRIKNILNYKRPAFWVIVIAIAATFSLIAAFTANPQNRETHKANIYSGYAVKTLLDNKTPYVGNNSKDIALIDAMPLPLGITRKAIELQTDAVPYGITINYSMNDASGIKVNGAIRSDAFYRNSVMLLSLIDNADVINCKITDNTGKYDGASYSFTYTRKMAEKLIGKDVRSFSGSTESIKKLIDLLNGTSFDSVGTQTTNTQTAQGDEIENYLKVIISSPKESSNPKDYINAHQEEYYSILKMGDDALDYLLSQFKKGSSNNLKGYIMMALCTDLLGDRNNIKDESLSPQDWFSKLSPYKETKLPDFKANATDPIEQLVYDVAIKEYSRPDDGFTIAAPTIFGSYKEQNKLKVFATVYISRYKLYNKTLSEVSGSIVPAAITYIKGSDGKYTLKEYKEAEDGSYFGSSIQEFCTMPVSGKVINGLYSKIINDYGSNKNRDALLRQNLIKHLKDNNQNGITLKAIGTDSEIPLT